MPELPEIETIKRGLEEKIVGKEIISIERFDVAPSTKPDGQFFTEDGSIETHVKGKVIEGIERKGKGLIFHLNNDYSLLIHLKMTGQLVYDQQITNENNKDLKFDTSDLKLANRRFVGGHPTDSLTHKLPDNTTRTICVFDDGGKLYFNDQRKFGYIKLKKTTQLENEPFLSRLGPGALGPDFTSEYLYEQLQRRRTSIKAVLLDQSTVAGLGNIYVDEVLHLAKIHSERKANQVSEKEVKELHQAIQTVLNESIERGGTTFTNFVNHLGVKGDYLKNARVFRREGEKCRVCDSKITKKKVAGRGTHICPNCQK